MATALGGPTLPLAANRKLAGTNGTGLLERDKTDDSPHHPSLSKQHLP